MEKTPLQLYQKAFNLHHIEDNVNDAIKIYTTLISKHANSNVADYASVQLKKIESNRELAKPSEYRISLHPAIMILIILNILITTGTLTWLGLHIRMYQTQQDVGKEIEQALGKMYAGKDDEAIAILHGTKILNRTNIVPYRISAEIYLKRKNYIKARSEYEAFQRHNPSSISISNDVASINRAEANYNREKTNLASIKNEKMRKDSIIAVRAKKRSRKYENEYKKSRLIRKNDISYF